MTTPPPTVLLIDAHEDCRLMHALGLEALGFQPVTADSAETGFVSASA